MKSSSVFFCFAVLFWLVSQGSVAQIIRYEIPEEKPCSENEKVIQRKYYTLLYDYELLFAKWVAYQMKDTILIETSKLTNKNDFKSQDYDMGHLVPNKLLNEKVNVYDNEFDIYNIAPQTVKLNRGIWRTLEKKCYDLSLCKCVKKLYIVTGGIPNETKNLLNNKISIPKQFFKVILVETNSKKEKFRSIGYLIPNNSTLDSLSSYDKSVNEIETITGFNFFHELDDEIEEQIESEIDEKFWGLCNSKCTKKSLKKGKNPKQDK